MTDQETQQTRRGGFREAADPAMTLDLIRRRLDERAFLFEDHNAYRGGVEDALREVGMALDEEADA